MPKVVHSKGKGETSLFGYDFWGEHSLKGVAVKESDSIESTLSAQ